MTVCLLVAVIILAALKLRQKSPTSSQSVMSTQHEISSATVKSSYGETSYTAAALKKLTAQGGLLMLVNKTNKLTPSYVPNLVTVPSSYYRSADKDNHFDSRAAPYLKKMIDDGRAAGYNLVIYSGYRTYDYQKNNFDSHVKEYEAEGKTYAQAAAETAKLVAPPGTSEHETGLAVDIVSTDYIAAHVNDGLIATAFDKYSSYKWLINNCAKYGFILRYLKNKVSITKYDYESWHFRFVGVNDAKKIVKKGLCLEEYVANLKK